MKLLSKDGKSVCAVSEDQQGYDSVSIQVRKLFEQSSLHKMDYCFENQPSFSITCIETLVLWPDG